MEDEETRKERASGMFWKAEKQKGMLRKRTYETTVLTSKFIFKKEFLKKALYFRACHMDEHKVSVFAFLI